MNQNEKGLQETAQETADLIIRLRDGLQKLNREKLLPTVLLIEEAAGEKPKPKTVQ